VHERLHHRAADSGAPAHRRAAKPRRAQPPLIDLQRSAGNRAVAGAVVQRREVAKDADIKGTQDWTTADRENNAKRWQDACLSNLNAVDSSQYVRVVERRDFYKWFYDYSAGLGFTTRWSLAARLVADGAHQIADMDENHSWSDDGLGMANVQLQGIMREGNQVIFDNVLPKLKKLIDGGPLTGNAALNWDMQVLAEEQALVQPLYDRMTTQTFEQLDYIARKKRFAWLGAKFTGGDDVDKGTYNKGGTLPEFGTAGAGASLKNPADRWRYGMDLGNTFAPGSGTGFDPAKNPMPAAGAGYKDGSELAKVDTRPHLHELDAWLNPNKLSRPSGTSGSDYNAILGSLTESEKKLVVQDKSADGWAYSIQFAQFSFITEAEVRMAMPSDPALAALVSAFMARWKKEKDRIYMTTPDPMFMGGGF
jgi:hypothetical protein